MEVLLRKVVLVKNKNKYTTAYGDILVRTPVLKEDLRGYISTLYNITPNLNHATYCKTLQMGFIIPLCIQTLIERFLLFSYSTLLSGQEH